MLLVVGFGHCFDELAPKCVCILLLLLPLMLMIDTDTSCQARQVIIFRNSLKPSSMIGMVDNG